MKPLAVYKLSQIEAALVRLNAAMTRLEGAFATREAMPAALGDVPDVPAIDAAEVADLRRRCDVLTDAVRQGAEGVDATVARLRRILEG